MTSCQFGVVSIALSYTMFQTFDVEAYRELEIYVRGESPCKFMHGLLHDGSVFIRFNTASSGKKVV